MKKAVAPHAIFLIAVIVITFIFTVVIFSGWIKINDKIANPLLCRIKLQQYCSEWGKTQFTKEPSYNWDDDAPGCVKIGILKPDRQICNQFTS